MLNKMQKAVINYSHNPRRYVSAHNSLWILFVNYASKIMLCPSVCPRISSPKHCFHLICYENLLEEFHGLCSWNL